MEQRSIKSFFSRPKSVKISDAERTIDILPNNNKQNRRNSNSDEREKDTSVQKKVETTLKLETTTVLRHGIPLRPTADRKASKKMILIDKQENGGNISTTSKTDNPEEISSDISKIKITPLTNTRAGKIICDKIPEGIAESEGRKSSEKIVDSSSGIGKSNPDLNNKSDACEYDDDSVGNGDDMKNEIESATEKIKEEKSFTLTKISPERGIKINSSPIPKPSEKVKNSHPGKLVVNNTPPTTKEAKNSNSGKLKNSPPGKVVVNNIPTTKEAKNSISGKVKNRSPDRCSSKKRTLSELSEEENDTIGRFNSKKRLRTNRILDDSEEEDEKSINIPIIGLSNPDPNVDKDLISNNNGNGKKIKDEIVEGTFEVRECLPKDNIQSKTTKESPEKSPPLKKQQFHSFFDKVVRNKKTETKNNSGKTAEETNNNSEKNVDETKNNSGQSSDVQTKINSEKMAVDTKNSFNKTAAETKNNPGKSVIVEGKPGITKMVISDFEYDPSKENYDPVKDVCWIPGKPVPYLALARTFEEIESISARNRSIEILSNFLTSVSISNPSELLPAVYLCLNRLAPAYMGVELGLGEHLLMKAICQATGRSMEKIKADVQEKGDLGLVAEASRSNQKTMFAVGKLTVVAVFNKLKEIANMTGHSCMTKKTEKIKSMFVCCRGCEARFLIRSLNGKLRIGMAEQSVLHALAQAVVVATAIKKGKVLSGEKLKKEIDEASLILKTTYCECPNYDRIVPLLLEHSIYDLPEFCKLTPGIPLKPMLAHPTKGISEVLQRFGTAEFVSEFKYDGERAQIHVMERGMKIEIYSRNQENNTNKFPDIVARMHSALATPNELGTNVTGTNDTAISATAINVTEGGDSVTVDEYENSVDTKKATCEKKIKKEGVEENSASEKGLEGLTKKKIKSEEKESDYGARVDSAVLDCEAVAWDVENKQILPFQVLSTRKRKDASSDQIKVQVCVYAFDLLYLNDHSLVKESLRERRRLLHRYFREVEGEFVFAQSLESNDVDRVAEFLEESVRGNCEGLMVKCLDVDSSYEIAKRSRNWLKLKKDYLDGVGDTLDLVVIGGYHGSGKRVGRYGGFLLACYDPDNEEFQTICKIGTGFSDADLEKHFRFFSGHILANPRSYYRYDSGQTPDHWFDTCQVWEVKAADLSLSPVYRAASGLVDAEKGISLRFPRFVRIREDKKVEDATASSQVASMYRSQDQIINQLKNKAPLDDNDDEYY